MKSFKKEYRQAFDAVKTPQFEPEKMKKAEKRYRKAMIRQWTAVAASAAVLFVLCSAGTQAAKSHSKSFIFADENGFRTADEQTALYQAAEADGEEYMQETMADNPEEMLMMSAYEGTEEAAYDAGNADFYEQCQKEAAQYDSDDPEISDGEGDTIPTLQYGSLKELKAAGIKSSLPDRYLFGDITRERYYVVGDDYLMADIQSGEKNFYMDQSYYGNSEGHASSTVYGEKLTNKRNYVTKDGYLYVVADTSGGENTEQGIHAAISVGDYELILDFYGYSESEAFEMLDHLNLGVYQ